MIGSFSHKKSAVRMYTKRKKNEIINKYEIKQNVWV